MARNLPEHIQLVVFLVALGTAIGGLYAYVQATQVPRVTGAGPITVSLLVEGPGWTIHYGPAATTNNTPFSFLREAASHLGFTVEATYYQVPSAVFVTAINGTTNGQGGMYWQYWVDGVYGNVGADHLALASGGTVTWRFGPDQGGTLG